MNSILKILVFRLIWIRSVYNFDKGLTHETSVLKLFMVANLHRQLSWYNQIILLQFPTDAAPQFL